MSFDLEKGESFDFEKKGHGSLQKAYVGLGWDVNEKKGFTSSIFGGQDFDLDVWAVVVDERNRLLSDKHFVFFNNLRSPGGEVEHTGDNLTGKGDGDDEALLLDLSKMPSHAHAVHIHVTIYKGHERKQHLDQVQNAFSRVVDVATKKEICRFEINGAKYMMMSHVHFASFIREGKGWIFHAVGEGSSKDIGSAVRVYTP